MKKTYLILGDNNFWYATIFGDYAEADHRIFELKNGIDTPEDAPSDANTFYLYEVNGDKETFEVR